MDYHYEKQRLSLTEVKTDLKSLPMLKKRFSHSSREQLLFSVMNTHDVHIVTSSEEHSVGIIPFNVSLNLPQRNLVHQHMSSLSHIDVRP